MAVFLDWKSTAARSKERFINRLFGYLSPTLYPINIIGTVEYDVLSAYAEEFASGSAEINSVFRDLSLSTARISAIANRSYSKLYDNFGIVLGVNKLTEQNYETFNTGSYLNSYREELRTLFEAAYARTSRYAVERVGNAYTGVAPLVVDYSLQRARMKLNYKVATVVSSNEINRNFSVLDDGTKLHGFMLASEGDTVTICNGKIGQTKIFSREKVLSSPDIICFPSSSLSTAGKSFIQDQLLKSLRVDQFSDFSYSDDYSYQRWTAPTGSSAVAYDTYLEITPSGVMRNSRDLPVYGHFITGSLMEMPPSFLTGSNSYYPDFFIKTLNDSHCQTYLRFGNSTTLSELTYFSEMTNELVEPMIFRTSLKPAFITTGSLGAHYLPDQNHKSGTCKDLFDISGNAITLVHDLGSPYNLESRLENRAGVSCSGSMLRYVGNTSPELFMTGDWYCMFWVWGLNSGNTGNIVFKVQNTVDTFLGLSDIGYACDIDISNSLITISWDNGSSTYTQAASIAAWTAIDYSQPHLCTFIYAGGTVSLYIDDQRLTEVPATTAFPVLTIARPSLLIAGGILGIDELIIEGAALTEADVVNVFENTKLRFTSPYFRPHDALSLARQYVQPAYKLFSDRAKEIEIHQFSVRGAELSIIQSVNNRFVEVPKIYGNYYHALSGSIINGGTNYVVGDIISYADASARQNNEILREGDFYASDQWSVPVGVTIGGGLAQFAAVAQWDTLSQLFVTTIGDTYTLTFTLSDSGVFIGGVAVDVSTPSNTNGSFSGSYVYWLVPGVCYLDFIATSTTFSFVAWGGAHNNLYNISSASITQVRAVKFEVLSVGPVLYEITTMTLHDAGSFIAPIPLTAVPVTGGTGEGAEILITWSTRGFF